MGRNDRRRRTTARPPQESRSLGHLGSVDYSAILLFAAWGTLIALIFCVLVTVIRIVAGQEPFSELNASYPRVVLTYLGCGLGGGTLVGAFRRWVRGRRSAALMGFVVGVPCGLAFSTAMGKTPPWSVEDLIVALIFGATLGAGVGFQYWRIFAEGAYDP